MRKLFILLAALMLSTNIWAGGVSLTGAGATFPYPFYSKVFNVYHKTTGVKVNYQAIGSGGGIRQLLNKTVDFGATDAFISDKKLAKAPAPIVHIPTVLGAVVVSYNLPGNPTLKLTPDIIADIFLGKIKKWNNPRIKSINKGVNLPNMKIIVAHRSDGSGTTFIFSDYLSKVSSKWEKKVGRGKSLNWPVGLGGKGNAGVAGLIKQIPGAVGYVELIYALSNKMAYALVKNRAGNYIKPSIKSVSLAANINLPADTRVSLTNTDAVQGYPISSFTWLILYKNQNYENRSYKQAKETLKLFWFVIHGGQKYANKLHYAPIPEAAVKKAEKILKSVKYGNKKLLR